MYKFLVSTVVGAVSFMLCFFILQQRQYLAADFTWPYRAAGHLLAGENPYLAIQPTGGPYPFNDTFNYPIFAALAAIPFTGLDMLTAGAAFFGLGSALMAYGILKHRPQAWPVFLSPSFYISAWAVQWAPWIFAAALLLPVQWLTLVKPNLGIPALLFRTSRRVILILLALVLVSLLAYPQWLPGFLENALGAERYQPPFTVYFGLLLVLSVLKVRTPEGRVLLSLSMMPQLLYFYDQLLVWLVPKTAKQAALLSGMGWFGYILLQRSCSIVPDPNCVYVFAGPFIIWTIYYPALAMLLWPEAASVKERLAALASGRWRWRNHKLPKGEPDPKRLASE
jgi:hypothetical protein